MSDGEAILYDFREENNALLPEEATICRVDVRFPDGAPAPGDADSGLHLLFSVDVEASPRAWIQLLDLARQRGARPLNVSKLPNDLVRLVLTGTLEGRHPAGSLSWVASKGGEGAAEIVRSAASTVLKQGHSVIQAEARRES